MGDSTLNRNKLVFVARDSAPSKNYQFLAEEFPEATTFFGDGFDIKETDAKIEQAARNACVLVLGMSHSQEAARVELLAGQAADEHTQVVLLADSFFCSARSWFEPLRMRVNLVLACAMSEAKRARTLFQYAKVVASGNALWEKNYFATMTAHSRREAIREELGIKPDEKLFFVPLRKENDINVEHLSAIVKANAMLHQKQNSAIRFCITTHPGEPDAEKGLEKYKDIIKDNKRFEIVHKRTFEMLVACDLVLNAGSGVGVEALYLEIPVIEFLPKIVSKELGRLQGGAEVWQPCEDYAALAVTNETEMIGAIQIFIKPQFDTTSLILQSQREFYPAPKKPRAAVQSMAAEIKTLLRN